MKVGSAPNASWTSAYLSGYHGEAYERDLHELEVMHDSLAPNPSLISARCKLGKRLMKRLMVV
jgi:hypothetical protein